MKGVGQVASVFLIAHLSLQKEPSEVPTLKRPRGRPKGSKNKGAAKTRVRLEVGRSGKGLACLDSVAHSPGRQLVMGLR